MIKLSDYSSDAPANLDKGDIKDKTKEMVDQIGKLQEVMLAEKKHSLLIVYQGMDASGKDGATGKVFKDCHPGGLSVTSFKKPTDEEMDHDFLWRIHKHAPRKGMIQIFNRSHYEDILIQRVHEWIDMKTVEKRMRSINAFERLLVEDNDTTILKFYLHISYEQQEIELKERLTELDKHWKHNDNDWNERGHWNDYVEAYEYVFNNSDIPWHIIPVDQRWYRDYMIASIVLKTLEGMNLTYPKLKSNL